MRSTLPYVANGLNFKRAESYLYTKKGIAVRFAGLYRTHNTQYLAIV